MYDEYEIPRYVQNVKRHMKWEVLKRGVDLGPCQEQTPEDQKFDKQRNITTNQ